mgnify:CR=1 FL=1
MVDLHAEFDDKEKKETIDIRKVNIKQRMGWDKKVQTHARELALQKKPFCTDLIFYKS